ncbi:MAG TPA: NADP oxidoreductase [Deltaproteobacteria bacterium]|nr:NADP oxidoreductase [Deltaproteobacteria bacterium]
MAQVGSAQRPLRVAIVGSGPSGFYTAAALLQSGIQLQIDLLDRLPTPFGLVRGGVAPDHQKIKGVVRAYNKTAQMPGFRFLGNVTVGVDVSLQRLLEAYDQVVLAVGASSSRKLHIEGEELPGSHAATDFVGWYNGHPDHQHHDFDLSCSVAVVVGVGNVAMDVTRILAQDPARLTQTDITDAALDELRDSKITDIYVLGRRGPAQAAFSPAEIRELDEIEGVDLIVRPEDAALDPCSAAWLEEHGDKRAQQNVAFLQEVAQRQGTAPRRVHLRLRTSPIAYRGPDRVRQVELGRNVLECHDGEPTARDTGEREQLDAGLVLRAVGYRGVRLPGAPFDERRGIIPNRAGQVIDGEAVVPRLFVVGWAKRGPKGLIGTNRADAKETVEHMLAALPGLDPTPRDALSFDGAVSWDGWERLDALELAEGEQRGKIRQKFLEIDAMLGALEDA